MRWKIGFPGLRGLVVLIAVLALVAVFVPLPYVQKVKSLGGGAVAALSAWAYQGGVWVNNAWQRTTAATPSAQQQEADRQNLEDLRNRLIFLSLRIKEQNEEIADLTRIRSSLQHSEGQLIPAWVQAGDAGAWRDVLQIRPVNLGTENLMHVGDWVLSPLVVSETSDSKKNKTGFSRLAGSVLVGSVVEVGPLTIRVKLLSDPASALQVSILRIQDAQLVPVEKNVILEGRGDGRMLISDLKRDTGVRVGDVVVSEAGKTGLWGGLVIGRVVALEEHPKPRLLVRAEVESPMPLNQLLRVYVLGR